MGYKKTNDIIYLKSCLNLSSEQLFSLLGLSSTEIEEAKVLEQKEEDQTPRISLRRDKSELENFINSIRRDCSSFMAHHMVAEDIIKALTSHLVIDEKIQGSLILLYRNPEYAISYKITEAIEKICFEYFKSYEIGDRAPKEKRLNRDICEKVLGKRVDIKTKTHYEEHGGDYDTLEAQYESEVYSDGGGSWWEEIPQFSTDMGAAWTIVEKLAKEGVQVRLSNKAMNNDYWWCYAEDQAESIVIQEESAPIAICEMALKVVEQRSRDKNKN